MRRALLFIILLLAISTGSEAAPNAIKWARSFDAALAEAKRTNKLVMADFYADW
jgi:thiol:disulfide interchange protein